MRAGAAFHEALAGIPRPSFLDDRDNAWTYGERLAHVLPAAASYRSTVDLVLSRI